MSRRRLKKKLKNHIRIKDILFFEKNNHSGAINGRLKKIIRKEFYSQLEKASARFGKPHFSRDVTIYITEKDRCFNSKDSYIAIEKGCINWDENKPTWYLLEALSHELAHLIFGNRPYLSHERPASVMEEGLAYYHSIQEYTWFNYEDKPRIREAIACIEKVLKEVPDLLAKLRTPGGAAPIIQMLSDDDLKKLGIGEATLRSKLLEDFVYQE
jgi:hypothetical protein